MKTFSLTYSAGTINLLTGYIRLHHTEPLLTTYKDGGIFRDSKISPGRRPVYRQNASVVETVTVSIYGTTKTHVSSLIRQLKTIADEAFDYWRPGSLISSPVYISAAVGDENANRYAMIYKMEISGLTDLYTGSYEGGVAIDGSAYLSGFRQITLTIERSEWDENTPGSGTNIVLNAVAANQNGTGVTLTHAFRYDDSTTTFSSNLIGAGLPYDLLPSSTAVADRLYIGADAPFSNVVFNIGTAMAGTYSIGFYYSNSPTPWPWSEMPETYNDGTNQFQNTGVVAFSFDLSSAGWVTATVNGQTKYWIAFNIDSLTSVSAIPAQATDQISTTMSGSTAQTNVSGDFDAKAKIRLDGGVVTASSRFLIGFKPSADSGFQSYLNLSTVQSDPSVSVAVISETTTAFSTVAEAPTGNALVFTPTDTGDAQRATMTLSDQITPYYKGKYRLFLRGRTSNVAGSFVVTVKLASANTVIQSVQVTMSNATSTYCYADLGVIHIYDNNPLVDGDDLVFQIWIQAASASYTLTLYDFAFIPADLSVVELKAPAVALGLTTNRYILVDSITSPRDDILAAVFNSSNNAKIANLTANRSGRMTIPANRVCNMYMTALDANAVGSFDLTFSATIDIDKSSLYDFAR